MNENNLINQSGDEADFGILETITPDVTSNIKTITDLWSLAHMKKDMEGDPVWDELYQLGCNPEPVENIGYVFDYEGFKGIYVPMRKSSEIIRFALPKLESVGIKSRDELNEFVNIANSMVAESKFTLMGNDVWLIYERHLSGNEDYMSIVQHILENLKSGAELFYKFFQHKGYFRGDSNIKGK